MKTGDTKRNFCICRPLELIPHTNQSTQAQTNQAHQAQTNQPAQAQSTHTQSTAHTQAQSTFDFDTLLRNQINQPNATIWKQLTDYYIELLANNMSEAEALDTLRNTAHTRFAIRAKVCPRGQTICCGTCTYVCSERCGLDIAIRIQIRLMTMKADQKRLELTMPHRQESALNRSIRLLVESPTSTASQFNALINQLISGYWNVENRRELRMNGNYENPNKLNYSPRLEYEAHPKSGKPRIKANPDTGEVVVLTWPNSGLCPFCLPTNSARHRMPKSR
jgi:hypothetical protein